MEEDNFNLESEDEDVAAERRRIENGLANDDIVRTSNLTKVSWTVTDFIS